LLLSCPSCNESDRVRKSSAVIGEQTSVSVSTSETYSDSRKVANTSTYGYQQSNTAGSLTSTYGASKEGEGTLGCGIVLTLLFAGFYTYTFVSGKLLDFWSQIGVVVLIATGIGLIYVGNRLGREDTGFKARELDAKLRNSRIADSYYCDRCSLRFDEQGKV